MKAWWLIALVLAGCRLQFGPWQGAPPRASDQVRLALHAPDDRVRATIEASWRRDPKVELRLVDPRDVPGACSDDGACVISPEQGCTWARGNALDYFVHARVDASSSSRFVCTRESGIFDKSPECIEGYTTDERSQASVAVATYDAITCTQVSTLSLALLRHEGGATAEDREAAADTALGATAVALPTFPAQVTVDAGGRITGTERGHYAMFRDRRYRGTLKVDDPATPGTMLTCCFAPAPGDVLVRRGRITQLSFDPSLTLTRLTVAGERELAAGLGLHLRHYKMDGGLEITLSGDVASATSAGIATVIGAVGWGIRPAPALRLSATAGGGLAYAVQSPADQHAYALAPAAWLGARAIVTPVPWLYVGVEAGLVYAAALDSWEGDGQAGAAPVELRAPMLRIFAALTQ